MKNKATLRTHGLFSISEKAFVYYNCMDLFFYITLCPVYVCSSAISVILTRVVGDTAVEILLVWERASVTLVGGVSGVLAVYRNFFRLTHAICQARQDISFVAVWNGGGGVDGVVSSFSVYGENQMV